MIYTSVVGDATTEKVIEKSRFLTYVSHTEGEEEARDRLARIRALHPLATHVCYAFVADKTGNCQRFSDDGEPQGTAGMPILGVIKAKELRETTVAVVRYFGGIKLGAGGLTRAYASSAAEGIAVAPLRRYESCVECSLEVGYGEIDALLRFVNGEEVLSKEYGERVRCLVAVRESEFAAFEAKATDFFNGKVTLISGKKCFYPFPDIDHSRKR